MLAFVASPSINIGCQQQFWIIALQWDHPQLLKSIVLLFYRHSDYTTCLIIFIQLQVAGLVTTHCTTGTFILAFTRLNRLKKSARRRANHAGHDDYCHMILIKWSTFIALIHAKLSLVNTYKSINLLFKINLKTKYSLIKYSGYPLLFRTNLSQPRCKFSLLPPTTRKDIQICQFVRSQLSDCMITINEK